jgi:hypothetical protein
VDVVVVNDSYGPRYYDQHGEPITRDEWIAFKFGILDYHVVRRSEIGEDIEISTVWLGLDHQHGDGAPLIFETRVFGGDCAGDTYRYSTLDEATAGHESIVAQLSANSN